MRRFIVAMPASVEAARDSLDKRDHSRRPDPEGRSESVKWATAGVPTADVGDANVSEAAS